MQNMPIVCIKIVLHSAKKCREGHCLCEDLFPRIRLKDFGGDIIKFGSCPVTSLDV
jgi:hypothetical protein